MEYLSQLQERVRWGWQLNDWHDRFSGDFSILSHEHHATAIFLFRIGYHWSIVRILPISRHLNLGPSHVWRCTSLTGECFRRRNQEGLGSRRVTVGAHDGGCVIYFLYTPTSLYIAIRRHHRRTERKGWPSGATILYDITVSRGTFVACTLVYIRYFRWTVPRYMDTNIPAGWGKHLAPGCHPIARSKTHITNRNIVCQTADLFAIDWDSRMATHRK